MHIETERLIVRPFCEKDCEALYQIKTAPQVLEFDPTLLKRNAARDEMITYIRDFIRMEEKGDRDTWRCYAIEVKESGEVVGCLTFSKYSILQEYEMGWMMRGEYTKMGYASEAAAAFSDYILTSYGIEYMIVFMDTDNPASYRTAEKSGFKLFEKRTVYDYHYNRYCDDYYYFRKYSPSSKMTERFYGDKPYDGRKS